MTYRQPRLVAEWLALVVRHLQRRYRYYQPLLILATLAIVATSLPAMTAPAQTLAPGVYLDTRGGVWVLAERCAKNPPQSTGRQWWRCQ